MLKSVVRNWKLRTAFDGKKLRRLGKSLVRISSCWLGACICWRWRTACVSRILLTRCLSVLRKAVLSFFVVDGFAGRVKTAVQTQVVSKIPMVHGALDRFCGFRQSLSYRAFVVFFYAIFKKTSWTTRWWLLLDTSIGWCFSWLMINQNDLVLQEGVRLTTFCFIWSFCVWVCPCRFFQMNQFHFVNCQVVQIPFCPFSHDFAKFGWNWNSRW